LAAVTQARRKDTVVMGQDEVARLITTESTGTIPLPEAIADELSFKLGLDA